MLAAAEGYRLWSASYDEAPNPLLALETRILDARLRRIRGVRFFDAGSGTGRWMSYAQAAGARVFGVDICHEMILQAGRKAGLGGRSALGDISALPICDNAADLAICSFTLGYLRSVSAVFRELARVARRVIVSDMHPKAVRAGWTRSFRRGDRVHELTHHEHSKAELDECARGAGLRREWRLEAHFGEPERAIFHHAGKQEAFARVSVLPALLITEWNRL